MNAIRTEAAEIAFTKQIVSRHRQSGIATIMIMLLVGLSLTAAVLGSIHFTRAAQDQLLSVHGQTQAQMRAWTGAETVRQYLVQLQANNQLTALAAQLPLVGAAASVPINIDGLPGVSAQFTAVDSATKPTQFTALISGVAAQGTKGQSSSTLEVVYAVANAQTNPNQLTFKKGVKLGGTTTLVTDTSTGSGSNGFTINVLGDVSANGTVNGVGAINSTGSISLDGGSSYGVLTANCDIRLTGSGAAAAINARRNVCLSGSAAVNGAVNANGSVLMSGSARAGDVAAIGNPVDVGSCQPSGFAGDSSKALAQTCAAPIPNFAVDMQNGSANSVKSLSNVSMTGGNIGNLQAKGNLANVAWNSTISAGAITGKITSTNYCCVHINQNASVTVSIPLVPRVTLSSSIIDAYDYAQIANYLFKSDAQGYQKVVVTDVSGIAAGEYYLASITKNSMSYVDYLCTNKPVSASMPVCTDTTPPPTICKSNSPGNHCFTYNSGTKTWSITVSSLSMAPGIAWFEGNLDISGTGTYYNTFIASGSITKTSGSSTIYALNYAGYDGTYNNVRYAPTGICSNSNFPNIYPKQFCDVSNKAYLQDADSGIGNYALVAGSVKGGSVSTLGAYTAGTYVDSSTYTGGDISIAGQSTLYGSVMSGNQFSSGGMTTINGSISALGLGSMTMSNSTGGTTTIVIRKTATPGTYDPGNTSAPNCIGCQPAGMKILWSRYL